MQGFPKLPGRLRKAKVVTCKCGALDGIGTFEVDGRHLVVESSVGRLKALIGLSSPRRVARTLLKNYCMRAAAEQATARADERRPQALPAAE